MHVPQSCRKNLDPRSDVGVFVGYDSQSKGYRVLLADDSSKIVMRWDVVFHESVLPGSKSYSPAAVLEADKPVDVHLSDSADDNNAVSGEGGCPDVQQSAVMVMRVNPMMMVIAAMVVRGVLVLHHHCMMRCLSCASAWWKASALSAVDSEEPVTVQQALFSDLAEMWKMAIDEQIASLLANGTWSSCLMVIGLSHEIGFFKLRGMLRKILSGTRQG
jgi:hypothetical protein